MKQRMFVSLEGIRCAGCLSSIETALRRHGAEKVDIDLASRVATIVYRGETGEASGYCAAVRSAGYRATLFAVLPEPTGE